MALTQHEIVSQLDLQPHPEGGFFKEVYRSAEAIPAEALPADFEGPRNYSTSIYFMLTAQSFSAFHRIRQDEIWHFYLGQPIELHWLTPDGEHHEVRVGSNLSQGEALQVVVPAGAWFAARVLQDFALVGCTVAPGFDFADFELAHRDKLIEEFPQHKDLIERFTR